MKYTAEKKKRPVKSLRRVVGKQPLMQLGNQMWRHPSLFQIPIYTGLGMLLGKDPENYRQIAAGGAATMFIRQIGLALKFGPWLIDRQARDIANNSGFRTNVAQKRHEFFQRTDVLWDYAFGLEAKLLYTPEERECQEQKERRLYEFLYSNNKEYPMDIKRLLRTDGNGRSYVLNGEIEARPTSPGIEKTYDGFVATIKHAMKNDYDRKNQTRTIGFDVNTIEDYLANAICCEDDTVLGAAVGSHPLVKSAREKTSLYFDNEEKPYKGLTLKVTNATHFVKSLSPWFWHTMATGVISTRIGRSLVKIKKEYDADIPAQILLWPGKERDPEVLEVDGLCEAIHEIRESFLTHAMGSTPEETEEMIENMTRPYELRAMELRRKFDPDYCDPEANVNWLKDLERLGDYPHLLNSVKGRMEYINSYMQDLDHFISEHTHLWRRVLERDEQDFLRYVGWNLQRLETYLSKNHPELECLVDQHYRTLESNLKTADTLNDLSEHNVPDQLLYGIEEYLNHIRGQSGDIYSVMNVESLRSARIAFHANLDDCRKAFYKENYDRFIGTVSQAMRERRQYSKEIQQVRLVHGLTVIHSQMYKDVINELRNYGCYAQCSWFRRKLLIWGQRNGEDEISTDVGDTMANVTDSTSTYRDRTSEMD